MFQRKRKLKKDKSKSILKLTLVIVFFAVVLILILEFFYFNYVFAGKKIVTPIAKNTNSKLDDLEANLYKSGLSFSSVETYSDESFKVILKDGIVVILSSKKDIRAQLSSLQLILSRLTIEGKKLKSLDLRYDSPVISF